MTFGRLSFSSLGLVTWLAFGCATNPPPPQTHPDASIIGVKIDFDARWLPDPEATGAYFVRTDDSAAMGQLIESNFHSGGYIYLLNASPGQYALVAAKYPIPSGGEAPSTSTVTFKGGHTQTITTPGTVGESSESKAVSVPDALFQASTVTLRRGEFEFIGEAVLEVRWGQDWDDVDETQRRYLDLLDPSYRNKSYLMRMLSSVGTSAGYKLNRSDEALERFQDQSRSRMAGTSWDRFFLDPVAASDSATE